MPLSSFHPVVRAWFEERFGAPTPPQVQGWPAIAAGRSALILAPTGSGKTLAAFLKCLDQLYQENIRPDAGVQVLYISPLKALNNDIYKNLEVPLRGIEAKASELGVSLPRLTTAVRTGDTPQKDRAAMLRRPPHLLITTPESLYLMLTSKARQMLRTVRYVIVDEIHAVCATKRGVHLSLSLERLEAITAQSPVRIGLSATQRPLAEIARYLGGVGRPVQIIDTGTRKQLDLQVEAPLADMRALPEGSLWAAIHPHLLELIQQHRSTLIFVNYRGLAERLAGHLNELARREIARVHHGSMSRERREQVEQELKEGRLPCLVATSSLELGIDIGAIDLVIQVESPKSVARGLQRVGRAGHVVGAASKGRLVPKFRGELLEMACIVREMSAGHVEETQVPTGALDVLAQQITAMAAVDDWEVGPLLTLVRQSYCYRDLTERQLHAVLEMLSGTYPSDEFRDLRPRIVWDREAGRIRGREAARSLAILSGGTIPDRGYYGVYIHGSSVKLGEMDEEFVYESRVGDLFLLGTATWRIMSISHERITVTEAFSATPRKPFWKGDGLGRPFELGLTLGAFTRSLVPRLGEERLGGWLQAECALEPKAAENLIQYLQDQIAATGALPTDRQLVVELFDDELGDRRVIIHSPFGGRVHLGWSMVLRRKLRDLLGLELEVHQTDDGLIIRLPGADAPLPLDRLLQIDPAEAEALLVEEVGSSPVFGAFFRMNAGRALILPRPRPGKRQPFWLQRLKAADLLQVARRYDSFPVVLETYREVLKDVVDTAGLRQVLTDLQSGAITVHVVETEAPSPMSASLLMGFVGAHFYDGEAPKAERKGALLQLNRDLLREMLGSEQLRELLDPRAIAEVGQRLQRLAEGWRPRNADETEDLLRQVGDLTAAELEQRGVSPQWLAQLAAERRAVLMPIAGEDRWIAAIDQALYADLTGSAAVIIRRMARSSPPFQIEAVCDRYGYGPDLALLCLNQLEAEGLLAAGEYTPGRSGREYCDTEVLRQIHRQTLTFLRREVEPVSGPVYARFLQQWQGLGRAGTAPGGRAPTGPSQALRRALAQLGGVPLAAELWEREILPSRAPGYQPAWLDQLCAMGELHWVAFSGTKLAFYGPEQAALFGARLGAGAEPGAEQGADTEAASPALSPEQSRVLAALTRSGADFLGGVARTAAMSPADTLERLWELVWLGLVTNDTYTPLRQVLRARQAAARRGRPMALQGSTGRWSLTARLAAPQPPQTLAERYATLLLDRYGVVTREAAQSEEGPVPWSAVLDALSRMEWRGKVRRGYFIQELSGAQFALPEALERLRAARAQDEAGDGDWRLINACDPANPYGAILPPPEGGRYARLPSVSLVLEHGRPVLLVESSGRRLTPLAPLEGARLRAALGALKQMLTLPRGLRRIAVVQWGESPIQESAAAGALRELGFERTPSGLVLYR